MVEPATPPRLLFCGDPHGQFEHILRAAQHFKPLAVILLGDLQPRRPLHEELALLLDLVWFIHGNHDTDSEADYEHVFDSALAGRNLHGRVATLPDGTRIAGLGGVFRASVWDPAAKNEPRFGSGEQHGRETPRRDRWREGRPLRHWSTIYPGEVDVLAEQRADILVTHEAGAGHPQGFAILDTLAQCMRVDTAFHGHHHDCLDYSGRWEAQGFRSFGVGLRGISDELGRVIVAGQLDVQRQRRQGFMPGEDLN